MKKLPRWAAACKKPKWPELHLFSSMASVKNLILAEFRCENATNLFSMKSTKGQMISKGFLVASISSKKQTKEFDFTTMIPQVDLFSFVFWRKSKTPKNHFEII